MMYYSTWRTEKKRKKKYAYVMMMTTTTVVRQEISYVILFFSFLSIVEYMYKSNFFSNLRSFYKMVRYGQILGKSPTDVEAYSNGNDEHFSGERNYVHGIFTGYKWQCVEYARRWLLLSKTCIFGNIGSAADAWKELTYVQRVTDGRKFPLLAHANGSSTPPKKGSFLIWPRSHAAPFGHIAVITDVTRDYICIAEQNYRFHSWQGNYARQISMRYKDGGYYLQDYYKITGWMEIIDDHHQLQPLDDTALEIIRQQQ